MNPDRYSVRIVWSDEDQAFLASVPELPGCIADGKTQKEVIRNLQVVISEWIETARELGRDIPSPIDAASVAMMEAKFNSSIRQHIEREATAAVRRILDDLNAEDVQALRYKKGFTLLTSASKKDQA